jgi:hypothetical protein
MKQQISIILILLTTTLLFSQNADNQQKIKANLEDYFHFERENIHVQFNKTIYVSNENIAFKGYVFNKQSSVPNLNTTNIQMVIYDTAGKEIQRQLLPANFGTFDGIATFDKETPSGKYRFHFYTNWMNNFMEDESFVQTIEIINKNEPYNLKINQADFNTASISFNSESGAFIKGINNTIGIQIKDCNEIGIQIMEGFVVDSKGATITTFFTNKMGYGKLELTPDLNETYSVKIATDKLKLQKQLPKPSNSGMAISYNNNLPNNVLEVSVKTNTDGANLYQNKNYILLIHQNGKHIQKEFNFNDKNHLQTLTFDKNELANGVNSIRIIDENLNEIAERLVYINKAVKAAPILESSFATNGDIILYGKVPAKEANLSISVLPKDSRSNDQKNSILGSLYLNAYLEKPVASSFTYYDRQNVTRANDMELLLLNHEKSKYHWNNISTNKPKEIYKFTKGVTINGTVVKALNPKKKYKVMLISLKDNIFEEATVDSNNKFSFDNFFARDSTAYMLELMDESNIPIETKIVVNILNAKEDYRNKLNFTAPICPETKDLKNIYYFADADLEKKTIALNEIAVNNNYKKSILTHENDMNNSTAKGYKIGDKEYGTALTFLGRNGYITGVNEEFTVYIRSTRDELTNTAINMAPAIFIDNVQIFDLNILFDLELSAVDEIYIDRFNTSVLANNGNGTVKIYLKKGANTKYMKSKHNSIVTKLGFAKTKAFQTTKFAFSKEYDIFGAMQWFPNVFLDAEQLFEVKFPNSNQKEIQVLIEGFTVDGQFISEQKKLSITTK